MYSASLDLDLCGGASVCSQDRHPVAVLISADDLAALEETLDVRSSPEAMRQLAESRAAIEAGDVLDGNELAALMAKRSRRAR